MSEKKAEQMNQMVEEISQKINMLNVGIIKVEDVSDEKLENITDLHQMVMKKDSFSPSEMQAIIEELATLRKK
ncbi:MULTISPECIES: DUF1128 domain-containing protein [Bacillus]|nr:MULTISPECIES: DUF1128 domain-containing protein [Bacillus]MBP1082857.1 uncharacterized protein YfkK (UPF0435 family) [Bacillus capparidis]MED1098496.1 DUF1128 domain-containing protein [Bacillus capparidis]